MNCQTWAARAETEKMHSQKRTEEHILVPVGGKMIEHSRNPITVNLTCRPLPTDRRRIPPIKN